MLTVHLAVPLAGRVGATLGKAALERYYAEEEAEAMKPACEVLDAAGFVYAKHMMVGPIAESIVETAKSLGCELIMMGTNGRGKVGARCSVRSPRRCSISPRVPVLLTH